MQIKKRLSAALFFTAFGVALPFLDTLSFECRLVGEASCFHCALYFLISGIIPNQGLTCKNELCATRMLFNSMLWTLGMCGIIGALFETNGTHYIWGTLGSVSLVAGFGLYWHVLFRSKTPATAYDYQTELTDEEVWWFKFNYSIMVPVGLMTLLGLMSLMVLPLVYMLLYGKIPNGPVLPGWTYEKRVFLLLPMMSMCALGMLSNFETMCLSHAYFDRIRKER